MCGRWRADCVRPLNSQHLAIATFRDFEIVHQRAGIAEIAKRVGQFALVVRCAIISDRCFPGRAGLDEIATMEKNPRAMFVIFSHEPSACSNQPSALRMQHSEF